MNQEYKVGDKVHYIGTFFIREVEIVKIRKKLNLEYTGGVAMPYSYNEYLVKFPSGKIKIATKRDLF